MTSREYLLNQAEHCRRAAEGIADRFFSDELKRLAMQFEEEARDCVMGSAPAGKTALA